MDEDIKEVLPRDTTWSHRQWDCGVAMAAMSHVEANEFVGLAERTLLYGMNGIPGFNLGTTHPEADSVLARLRSLGGLVEANTAACVFTTQQQQEYLAALPELARQVAMRSRVAFPFTALGKTSDGCGLYGRQFRDQADRPTMRNAAWYADLAERYAEALQPLSSSAASVMRNLQPHCELTVASADAVAELEATLATCAQHVDADVVDVPHAHAALLFPLLVEADRTVGVGATKIYDAKLALSMIARQAVTAGLTKYSVGSPARWLEHCGS